MKKFWKKTEGFTLVELVVVIAILAQLEIFAPSEDISTSFFGKNSWWLDNSAWWGLKPEASVVTGTLGIPDEDGKNWTYDGK